MRNKILRFIVAVVILGLSYGVYYYKVVQMQVKPAETLSKSSLDQGRNPVGSFSDGWVDEIYTAEEFYEAASYDYLVVTALDVVPTGVYVRKSWIGPYIEVNSRRRRIRSKIPQESTREIANIQYMHQYYLIKLSDGSYINAILEKEYVDKIKKDGKLTLPIGIQEGVTDRAKQMLSDITEEYGAEPRPVLYMIDDDWYSKNEDDIIFKAIIWGIGTCIILIIICALTMDKVFED